MKTLCKIGYRIRQRALHLASFMLPWREPQLFKGSDAMPKLASHLFGKNIRTLLIVTDANILQLGLMDSMLAALKAAGITTHIYSETTADPTIQQAEAAARRYRDTNSQAIIAFGGGSPMDCGKAAAACLSRPKKSLAQMGGLLRVLRRTVPLYAVPTTAGTGSEATVAAVITDPASHRKFAINDLCLIPDAAVLDPALLAGLPAHITAATGMDTLCHAIEAYIGKSTTRKTRQQSIEAVKLVFENLETSFREGGNLEAREKMQTAAYLAGLAFTRSYVGYVHALSHNLGAFYGIPHGLANAVVLPIVLEAYGEAIHRPLARLADELSLSLPSSDDRTKSELFIQAIRAMNQRMGIPAHLPQIQAEDIDAMVANALKEANPTYPVPLIWFAPKLKELYTVIAGTKT